MVVITAEDVVSLIVWVVEDAVAAVIVAIVVIIVAIAVIGLVVSEDIAGAVLVIEDVCTLVVGGSTVIVLCEDVPIVLRAGAIVLIVGLAWVD